jgi:hypothetical protein
MPDPKPPRQIHGDRNEDRKSRPFGVPVMPAREDATGVISGPDLDAVRERRPTPVRFKHVEDKLDDHANRLGRVEVAVAGLAGEMKIFPKLTETMERSIVALQQRDQVTFDAHMTVGTAKALDKIEVKKWKRGLFGSLVAAAIAGGGALLHYLAGRL